MIYWPMIDTVKRCQQNRAPGDCCRCPQCDSYRSIILATLVHERYDKERRGVET